MFPLIMSIIGDTVKDGILGIFLLIDSVIYWAVAKLYGLFIDIASARIFSQEAISSLGNRIYGLIGIIMLFVVAYSLLTAIVDPGKVSKGDMSTGKLAKNIIISIIIIAILPTAFNFAYKVQSVVMKENVLGRILLGQGDEENYDTITFTVDLSWMDEEQRNDTVKEFDMEYDSSTGYYTYTQDVTTTKAKQYGYIMSMGVLNAFLNPENTEVKLKATKSGKAESVNSVSKATAAITCAGAVVGGVAIAVISAIPAGATLPAGLIAGTAIVGAACSGSIYAAAGSAAVIYVSGQEAKWSEIKQHVEDTGDFLELGRLSKPIVDGDVNYMPVASTICGAILLYVILSFCLDLGVRAAKLAFYQLIAPIPIMLRVVPKQDKVFSNWLKATLSTYFEVFVRLAVIYTITYLASQLFDPKNNNIVLSQLGLFGKAIVVMGLVAFAKQAPKLIGEVTGIQSDGLKLGIKDKLAAGGLFTAGAAVGGALSSGFKNFTNARNKGKGIGEALRSGMGGFFSGGFRGGKAGKDAKSWKDMANAATTGAGEAAKARDKRARYKSAHGGTLGGVVKGKFEDAVNAGRRFIGKDNKEALIAENATIDAIKSSEDALDATIEGMISKAADKGKDLNFGVTATYTPKILDANGNLIDDTDPTHALALNTANLATLDAQLQAAMQSGDANQIRLAKENKGKFLKAFTNAVKSETLQNNTNFDSLVAGLTNADEIVGLKQARVDAEKLMDTLVQNTDSSFIKEANELARKDYIAELKGCHKGSDGKYYSNQTGIEIGFTDEYIKNFKFTDAEQQELDSRYINFENITKNGLSVESNSAMDNKKQPMETTKADNQVKINRLTQDEEIRKGDDKK